MLNRTIKVSLEDVRDIMLEKLNSGGEIVYSPKGVSMLPCIKEGRDSVVLKKSSEPYKKGDIVFYRRSGGAFVIHRIVKRQKDGKYTICGDNQKFLEKDVPEDIIMAKVSSLTRNGKEVNFNSFGYKLYCKLLFLRRFYLRYLRKDFFKIVKAKLLLKK